MFFHGCLRWCYLFPALSLPISTPTALRALLVLGWGLPASITGMPGTGGRLMSRTDRPGPPPRTPEPEHNAGCCRTRRSHCAAVIDGEAEAGASEGTQGCRFLPAPAGRRLSRGTSAPSPHGSFPEGCWCSCQTPLQKCGEVEAVLPSRSCLAVICLRNDFIDLCRESRGWAAAGAAARSCPPGMASPNLLR